MFTAYRFSPRLSAILKGELALGMRLMSLSFGEKLEFFSWVSRFPLPGIGRSALLQILINSHSFTRCLCLVILSEE